LIHDPLVELRREFDQIFAAPRREKSEELENLLAIRIKGDSYALNVREISGVETAGPVVPLPSRNPALLGITGLRGGLVPVYSLAALLGYEPGRETQRWLALCGAREPLAFAIGVLEGYVRLSKADLHVPDREPRKHVHQFARIGEAVRAIVSIPSVISAIQTASAGRRQKEDS